MKLIIALSFFFSLTSSRLSFSVYGNIFLNNCIIFFHFSHFLSPLFLFLFFFYPSISICISSSVNVYVYLCFIFFPFLALILCLCIWIFMTIIYMVQYFLRLSLINLSMYLFKKKCPIAEGFQLLHLCTTLQRMENKIPYSWNCMNQTLLIFIHKFICR